MSATQISAPKAFRGMSYTLHGHHESSYSHFRIVINERRPFAGDDDKRDLCVISWQSDDDSNRSKWYGATIESRLCPFDGPVEERALKIAKLLARLAINSNSTPRACIEALESIGITRTAYDGRLSRHVSEADMQPETFARYIDDYSRYGFTSCQSSALAETVEDAQNEILKEMASHAARFPSYADRLAMWISAGRPVKRDTYAHAPSFPSVASLLNEATAALVAA